MQNHFEKIGVLGPVYRLAVTGMSDQDIADRLHLPERMVNECVDWLLHSLHLADRESLSQYAESLDEAQTRATLTTISSAGMVDEGCPN